MKFIFLTPKHNFKWVNFLQVMAPQIQQNMGIRSWPQGILGKQQEWQQGPLGHEACPATF